MKKKDKTNKGARLIISFILVFCMLGAVVFSVSWKISEEMSASAIDNLSESLNLIEGTIEAILQKEAEFQKLIAQEIATMEDSEEFVHSCKKNQTMVKMSLILSGKTEGISNTGGIFSEEELDFSSGKTVDGLPISESYVNDMGTWAYTMKCPVLKGKQELGTLYIEYIYDSFEKTLPGGFYNDSAMLYIMDAESERLVLKPKGAGERNAGHLNLEDFYRANNILESNVHEKITESVKNGDNIMFYHDIRNRDSLIFMWSVNDGSIYIDWICTD